MSAETGTCWRNTGLPGTQGLWSCERESLRAQLTAAIARAEAAEAREADWKMLAEGRYQTMSADAQSIAHLEATANMLVGRATTAESALAAMSSDNWRPMSEHTFPWEPKDLLIAAVHADGTQEVFRCTCADHGSYYPTGSIIALNEDGWSPYAWSASVPPSPPKETDHG